jgi:hypothetical protein
VAVQWVQLGAGQTLVASARGAWIQRAELGAMTLNGPMPDAHPATIETTRQLLDGAIIAAEANAAPECAPPITAVRWAWYLVGQWYCAHHSVALLPELIARFKAAGDGDLAEFAAVKLEEERGHDLLPLADLRALGYDAEALVASVKPAPSVAAVVEYARSCAHGAQPAEFFGYVYALERRVLFWDEQLLGSIRGVLAGDVDALSGIRAHVEEFDQDHVAQALAFITGLPARRRGDIALGCHRTAQVLSAAWPGEHPPEAQLDAWLSPFRSPAARVTSATEEENDGVQSV